jgi:hypothetical protein
LRNVVLALGFCLLVSIAAPSSRASDVTLRQEVDVRGNSIYLSDLLPVQAPDGLRASFQGILVGVAPQPGSSRILDRSKIEGLLGTAAGNIEIPQSIVVRRTGRKISRDEVVPVIRAALRRSGLPDDLQPDDLRVFPEVFASSDTPALEVRRVDFDETLNQAKFLMAERGSLPFLVTAQFHTGNLVQAAVAEPVSAASKGEASRTPESAPVVTSTAAMLRLASGSPAGSQQFGGQTLVEAGKTATLFLNSGTMRMLLDVTALEKGSLNQTVRVKLPGTNKILRAQVTGAHRLEATF